jgi:hypothetical protein
MTTGSQGRRKSCGRAARGLPERSTGLTPVPGRWEIFVDGWRPASLNELLRGGPWGAHRLKRRDREYVVLFANLARVPRAAAKRRVSLRITLPPKQRRWDGDALWKSLLDACVRAGLLKDDGPKWCELGGVDYVRGKALSTTIIVEDIA